MLKPYLFAVAALLTSCNVDHKAGQHDGSTNPAPAAQDTDPTAPATTGIASPSTSPSAQGLESPVNLGAAINSVDPSTLRSELARRGVTALIDADFRHGSEAKIWLGRVLFFDRLLSGNKRVACSTCHAQRRATTDGVSQVADQGERHIIMRFLFPQLAQTLPRNTPAIFNRGHTSVNAMFHDSRVHADAKEPSGFVSPAGAALPKGLDSALAVQAMFPVLEESEMLGLPSENELARLPRPQGVWAGLMQRLLANDDYRGLFARAYPGVPLETMGFEYAANAIAAFEEVFWRADNSAFDRFLRGDDQALAPEARDGAALFYGRAQCGICHQGALQSDNSHHSVAMPQFGKGKGDGPSGAEDWGYARVSGAVQDRYKFRTPSLRNVALTGPWGHDGAYGDLTAVVARYANPVLALEQWNPVQTEILGLRYPAGLFDAHFDLAHRARIAAACEFPGVTLSTDEIGSIVNFLEALTDTGFLERNPGVPSTVPSQRRDFLGSLPDIEFSGQAGFTVGLLRGLFGH